MRLVIQRVSKAAVKLAETKEVVGQIEKGLFLLVGIKKGDTKANADILAEKLIKLRIMADEEGKMNLSVKDAAGGVLIVSQFTLYANTKDGNRPSFIDAAPPEQAKEVYDYFIDKVRSNGLNVQTGQFGSYMLIRSSLDGPVTIIMES